MWIRIALLLAALGLGGGVAAGEVAFSTLEFGDAADVVRRKARSDPNVECFEFMGSCAAWYFTIARLPFDGKLDYRDGKLSRVRVLADEIEAASYAQQAHKLWKAMYGWVTNQHGEGRQLRDFPTRAEVDEQGTIITHVWAFEAKEIRVGVGKKGGGYYTTIAFLDGREAKERALASNGTPAETPAGAGAGTSRAEAEPGAAVEPETE